MNIARKSLQGVTYHSPSRAYNGYTLFTPLGGGAGSGVWLINMEGQFVHHWDTPLNPGIYGTLLPNGHLLYAGKLPDAPLKFGGIGGKLLEFNWDGKLVWEYEDRYMHHDFHRLPNGNTMVLRFVKTPSDIAAKVKGGVPGTELEGEIWADSFREITPDGKVVWEWLGYEHLDPETDAICPLCRRDEWTHVNTCFVLPDGDVLTSFLKLNTIAIIDKATGNFKWRWGPGELAHQHDPNMLDNGNILVFDNGPHRSSSPNTSYGMIGFSRVVEVNPKTDEIVWEYRDESLLQFNACFISGAQRLPNGNTLICEGPMGRFFEVTPDKELVWEYVSPFYSKGLSILGWGNSVFRAYRFGPDYPGLKGKDLDPDKIELTVRQKPIAKIEKEKGEKEAGKVKERLGRLGY